jgi:hypothetical protein
LQLFDLSKGDSISGSEKLVACRGLCQGIVIYLKNLVGEVLAVSKFAYQYGRLPVGTGPPTGYPPVGIRCFAAKNRLKQRTLRASFHSARTLCPAMARKNSSSIFVLFIISHKVTKSTHNLCNVLKAINIVFFRK